MPDLQPIGLNQRVITPQGYPTDYFVRWAQQRQMDIKDGVVWGNMTGNLEDQKDLNDALEGKASLSGAVFTGPVEVPNEDYDSTDWDGSDEVPTKNAVRDKVESMLQNTTPASASATGTAGTFAWDADYIYVCTATDTWKRVAIATW